MQYAVLRVSLTDCAAFFTVRQTWLLNLYTDDLLFASKDNALSFVSIFKVKFTFGKYNMHNKTREN